MRWLMTNKLRACVLFYFHRVLGSLYLHVASRYAAALRPRGTKCSLNQLSGHVHTAVTRQLTFVCDEFRLHLSAADTPACFFLQIMVTSTT